MPLVTELQEWLLEQRAKLARGNDVAKAMDYLLCMSNNATERALRGITLGRKAWLFAGSDRGGQSDATMYSFIVTAKMNDIDAHAWLADVLDRIADHPALRLEDLLPWRWLAPPHPVSLTPAEAA